MMNKIAGHSKQLTWVMGLLLTGLVAGCGGDGGSGSGGGTGAGAQAGVLGVSLTDAPACGFDEVNVTVRKVRVHQSDSANENAAGWSEITLTPPRTINLLNLNDPTQPNFALDNLGETSLPSGHYTQVRLVLEDNNGNQPTANWVVLSSTKAVEPLETPSAIRSGIKLINQFDVPSGQRVDLLLDFDACKSIVQRGNGTYALKPVIKVIPYVLNGIDGFVDPALLGSHVVVSAQVNGQIIRATVPNTNLPPHPSSGKFFLTRLPEGVNYDVVITADNHAAAVIAGVPVASSTSITTISTLATPFTLPASTAQNITGTVTLNPATDEEAVFITAKQVLNATATVNPAPTVTVKSLAATPLPSVQTGDFSYILTLPTGAPSLAPYGPLPISPATTGQSGVAGLYTVQAAATGYTTQSFPNIATGTTRNFDLIP
jgi:hypothetical protein